MGFGVSPPIGRLGIGRITVAIVVMPLTILRAMHEDFLMRNRHRRWVTNENFLVLFALKKTIPAAADAENTFYDILAIS
jgi:hypothetical protein